MNHADQVPLKQQVELFQARRYQRMSRMLGMNNRILGMNNLNKIEIHRV